MTQKLKIIIATTAFVLLIAIAGLVYSALRGSVEPEITLTEQPGQISASYAQNESVSPRDITTSYPIKAPNFTVEDLNGKSINLSELEGKPVVLSFWASWCLPCKDEMPGFERVYTELGSEIAFMMVNLADGQRETKENGAAYVSEQGFSFPVYYDTELEAAHAYSVRSIPTTIFINSNGFIVTVSVGQLDEDTLRYGIGLIQTGSENKIVAEYRKISAEEAQDMMNEADSFILLDVRTVEEFNTKHIPGAVLIPDYELTLRAEAELPDKSALILVYCRSGRRSANAANELVNMGYTNVYDFGGILDWPYD